MWQTVDVYADMYNFPLTTGVRARVVGVFTHILREASAFARSTKMGNTRASESGTSKVQALTLFFYINHSNTSRLQGAIATQRKRMNFDIKLIQTLLSRYIRKNISRLSWMLNGQKVLVSNVDCLNVLNVEEGLFTDGFNFKGSGRIQAAVSSTIQDKESPMFYCIFNYGFSCVFRVTCVEQEDGMPVEEIDSIKDDRIYLYKR